MDVEGGMSNLKKRKTIKGIETGENEDLISQLPDCVLNHIFSFLWTKQVVSTCILSKRWQHLWKSTTYLEFHCPYYSKNDTELQEDFARFVERMLRFNSSNLTRFGLVDSNMSFNTSRVDSWISTAVQRRVQELNLGFESHSVLSLPNHLCISNTLTALLVRTYGKLQLPSTVCFSNLKKLNLENFVFWDEHSFNRLFCGLPVLEELGIYSCRWDAISNVTISLPTLRRLRITVYCRSAAINCSSSKKKDCVIKIIAENLKYLYCDSDLTTDLVLYDMPLLANASLKFQVRTEHSRAAQHAANLFGGLRFAKSLTIGKESYGEATLMCLYLCNLENNITLFPKFLNLTTLEINWKVTRQTAVVLMQIIRNAPVLELLLIKKVYGGKWSRKPHPRCIEFCLKKCYVSSFDGHPADILFVKFLLKFAKVLERLKLYCSVYLCSDQKKLEKVTNLLEMLPRISNNCVIEFLKEK